MFIIIGGIIFGIRFFIYMVWIYMKSCVFITRGVIINDEKEINNVPMKQFFHFNFAENK